MSSQRKHYFEFNDSPWVPGFLRESIIEILGKTVINGNIYTAAVPVFTDFCQRSHCTTVLDLCSGSGESTAALMEGLKETGSPVKKCYLSDINPASHALSQQVALNPECLQALDTAIDASDVRNTPEHQARLIVAAFHHFKPAEAGSIINDAVNAKKAIFILEPFPRQLKNTLPFFIKSFIPGATNPLRSPKNRLAKALFTYLIPLIPLLGWWDTIISALRMYSEAEYRQWASAHEHYHWEYHLITTPLWGAITIFTGIPRTE